MFQDVKERDHVERMSRADEIKNPCSLHGYAVLLPRELAVAGIGLDAADLMPGLLQHGEPLAGARPNVQNSRACRESLAELPEPMLRQPHGAGDIARLGSANAFVAFAILHFMKSAEFL